MHPDPWALRCVGRLLTAATCALLAWGSTGAEEEAIPWRVYAGVQQFDWDTEGLRGHKADCRTEVCDDADFRRANLDASVGFRVGAERLLQDGSRLLIRAGAEAGLLFTEFDLSQHDLKLLDLLGVAAVGIDLGPLQSFLRAGFGATLTDDGRTGLAGFLEAAFDVPVSPDTAIRLAARTTERDGPDSDDLSLLMITGGSHGEGEQKWELDTQAGVSIPGALVGEDRQLSRAPFWQISVFRRIGDTKSRLGLGLDIAGFESMVRTDFKGVSGNERSKEVAGLAAVWDFEFAEGDRSRWRVGGGVKLADWEAGTGLLLDDQGEEVVENKMDLGVLLKVDAVFKPQSRFPILTGLEQVYWPEIDLSELRVRLGLQVAL
jgi:hypothetical protein